MYTNIPRRLKINNTEKQRLKLESCSYYPPPPGPHPVQIRVRIFRHIVVEDDIDPLDVHSSAKEISGYEDPPLEVLELLIARQPVYSDGDQE